MTPDYRALCAELIEAVLSDDSHIDCIQIARRARALLAEPEPEGPTDQEIEEWADTCPEAPLEEMDPEVHGWRRCFTAKEFSETIRAALARWGRPTPQPPADGEVPRIDHILRLAEIIREVDGCHDKGAAALAEAILSHPGICSAGLAALAQPVAEGPTDEELEKLAEPFSYVALGGWARTVDDEVGFARAVLARWGRPTPEATND